MSDTGIAGNDGKTDKQANYTACDDDSRAEANYR